MPGRKHAPRCTIFIWLAVPIAALCASAPWAKDPAQWTREDVQRVLGESPWAQTASAVFDNNDAPEPVPAAQLPGAAQAGMAGPKGVPDGRWDGGIGRNQRGSVPTLPVTVRWDSALPVRQALRAKERKDSSAGAYTAEDVRKDYIVAVLGLVPAGRYQASGHLETRSQSGEGSGSDPQDPEQMLEGLMATSRLLPRGNAAIRPEDAKLDAATGCIYLFFPRTRPITAADKEVLFSTRFGSMAVDKKFRLKEMMYKGQLEL
jgi:hypothetical protein